MVDDVFSPLAAGYVPKGLGFGNIKGIKAIVKPAAPDICQYALFPENAAPQELDELFRRMEEGSITRRCRWCSCEKAAQQGGFFTKSSYSLSQSGSRKIMVMPHRPATPTSA